jgi:predicted DNA-binding transcriptional regulator AlpA
MVGAHLDVRSFMQGHPDVSLRRVGESFEVLRAVEAGAIRIQDIASFLKCSQQRVVQLAVMDGFPAPFQTIHRKRLWRRAEIEAWAEQHWWVQGRGGREPDVSPR